ncbi:MAG: response regulator [Treponema sp.]|nr:response regulator [Treponema sp.]
MEKTYKVLIVDDDPMVAMINEQYVCKNKQFKVVGSCRNGQDALNFLEKNPADLVIMDVYMPDMDGLETLKNIRQKKIQTEVIMVTAANDVATLEDTMHLGVIDFLIKPFAYERFQIALEKFISNRNAFRDSPVLNQSSVDSIITNAKKVSSKEYPKGIQEKTLGLIRDYFEKNSGWLSGEVIAENVGLSSVTIRRYMNFLVGSGEVEESINYETGGRPSMLYKGRN